MNYIVRTMKPEEMATAIAWAEKEGWNPGLNDGDCFYNTDPNGFFVGELEGKIIAVKSAVRYRKNFGFMGFYIVKEEFRGLGYGLKIWQHAFNSLKGMISGMDGVVDQQPNYMKAGYQFAYRQLRYEGKEIIGKDSTALKYIEDVPFNDLVDYDSQMFPSPRYEFLSCWITQPGSSARVYYDQDKIRGYGIVRPCVKGFKVGPLFADDPDIAERIFLALADFVDGEEIYLDVPEINKPALEMATKYKMSYVFETARMYNGGIPDMDVNRVFGVTTFELG